MKWNPGPWPDRVRAVAGWLLPFVACLALVAVMTAMFVVVFTSFDSQKRARNAASAADRSADRAEATAQAALAQSRENRSIMERFAPCLPGDDPASPACVAKAQADRRLAEALAAVAAQHEAQNAKLAALLRRPSVSGTRTLRVPVAVAPRPAPPTPAPVPPPGWGPGGPDSPTAAPAKRTTTTTRPGRARRGK